MGFAGLQACKSWRLGSLHFWLLAALAPKTAVPLAGARKEAPLAWPARRVPVPMQAPEETLQVWVAWPANALTRRRRIKSPGLP
jgi:hypothetical protein